MKSNFEFLNRYWPALAQIGETAEKLSIGSNSPAFVKLLEKAKNGQGKRDSDT